MTDDHRTGGRVTDEAIRSMLVGRAERLRPAPVDVRLLVTGTAQDAARTGWLAGLAPRLSIAATTVAILVVGSVLVIGPLMARPVGSAVPSGEGPRSSSIASVPPAAVVHALSAAELGDLVRTRSAELAPRAAIVRATLTIAADGLCRATPCATGAFDGAGDGFVLRLTDLLVADFGTAGSPSVTGPFLVRFAADTKNGQPVLDVVARLLTDQPDGWTSALGTIRAGDPASTSAYAAVDGWLVQTPLHPCPSIPGPTPATTDTPVYGCPEDDYLTDASFQPVQADGSVLAPPHAIELPVGSYGAWAPDPSATPAGSSEPRRAIYVLQRRAVSCTEIRLEACVSACTEIRLEACLIVRDRLWTIVDRLDPIPEVVGSDASPTPTPFQSTPSPVAVHGTWPGGIPRSIAGQPVLIGLDAQVAMASATDATPFLIGGWLSPSFQSCSGGIGPRDPNPLGPHGCARYAVGGVPGIPYYPETLVMPAIDGPVVFRAHVHDPGAETCWDVAWCRERLVIDAVAWSGDDSTRAAPIGPSGAIGMVLGVGFMDTRVQPDKSQASVSEDLFALPIACDAPLPTLTFQIHGDPRLAMIAVFPDTATRERVAGTLDPSAALRCLGDDIARTGAPRWIARDNVLVLAVTGPVTADRIEANLRVAPGSADWHAIPLPGPTLDRSLETIRDYLTARAAGEQDHATGYRLAVPQKGGFDGYAEWQADTLRRHAAGAIDGSIRLLSDHPTEADVGADLRQLRPPGSDLWLYAVDYPGATDPALASETFVLIHDPASTFADWMLVRIAGAPYPQVAVRPPVAPPPGAIPSVDVVPGADGSGDTPCLPAGQECG